MRRLLDDDEMNFIVKRILKRGSGLKRLDEEFVKVGARAHRARVHRARCCRRVHVRLQLLLSLEPKIALCMTKTCRTTSCFDAPMAKRLLKYTADWRFDEEHWLLEALTCSLKGLEILANEGKAKNVAEYAENMYARTPLARVEAGGLPW